MIVSGPNMAGKSTFLRGIGVNAVLAQSGAPVRAVSLKLSPLAVTASICVLDSLEGGISRFYAEIHRLKQIMDLTSGSVSGSVSAGRVALGNKLARSVDRNPIVRHQTGGTGRSGPGEHARPGADRDPPGDRIAGHQLPFRRSPRRRAVALRLQAISGHRPDQQCAARLCDPSGLKFEPRSVTAAGSQLFHQALAGDARRPDGMDAPIVQAPRR